MTGFEAENGANGAEAGTSAPTVFARGVVNDPCVIDVPREAAGRFAMKDAAVPEPPLRKTGEESRRRTGRDALRIYRGRIHASRPADVKGHRKTTMANHGGLSRRAITDGPHICDPSGVSVKNA